MKHRLFAWVASLLLGGSLQMAGAQHRLVTYPAPEGAELLENFAVSVRQPGAAWQQVTTYAVKVDEVRGTRHHVERASMAYFDFAGEGEVAIISRRQPVESVRVRPLSYGISPQVCGNVVTFRLTTPRNLSVEVNGDIFHNLHLFANPIDRHNPLPPGTKPRRLQRDENLIYFGPGLHQLPGDTLNVPSGKTVYVAGGAIVRGCIRALHVENVRILGRGIVHPLGRGEGIHIGNSKNVWVEGVITTQCPTGGSDGVTLRNVKAISSYGWGDGLNVFASSNVLFDGVFCRNSDDCTTVYTTRKDYRGGCRNITMQHSVLWADVAHPIFIGLHGNAEQPDTIENLVYRGIDILDHREAQLDYQGCLAINAGNNNLVRNVRFEDIRIEDFRQGQLVNLRIFFNKKYCTAPGRGIENILFRKISYTGRNEDYPSLPGMAMCGK